MNNMIIYWIISGALTLILIYRLQKSQQIALTLIKLRFSQAAQVMFLLVAFITGFIIIPFIIIYTLVKHVKRWNRWRKHQKWN